MIPVEERLIVALDLADLSQAENLAKALQGTVHCFKVGHQIFTAAGPKAVTALKDLGARVFLDLKYHDIPHTVARAVEAAAALGADIINLHASGGPRMMEAAAQAASRLSPRPLLLAVTVLTSYDQNELASTLGETRLSLDDYVLRLARLAKEAGLDGVVASPREIAAIRSQCGRDFIILTPGIRSSQAPEDDQRRTATPGQAVAWGADFIVVGRPVTQAPDPVAAARKIIAEMTDAYRKTDP